MLTIISGRTGSGKTERLYDTLCREAQGGKALLLVPEQSSFQSEKKLLERLGPVRARGVEVLSFKRLCRVMTETYGGVSEDRLDDGMKAVLMHYAISNAPGEEGELEYYAGSLHRHARRVFDLVEMMLTEVNEYKMCLITPEQIMAASERVRQPVLAAKLRDSARIYAAYQAIIENTYADPDDDLLRLARFLAEHEVLRGYRVYIDGFTGFSAQEMAALREILRQAQDVVLTLCLEAGGAGLSGEESLFFESERTLHFFLRTAKELSLPVKREHLPSPGVRFGNKALSRLEERLFAAFRCEQPQEEEPVSPEGAVFLSRASDPYEEVRQAAEVICRLKEREQFAYRDIEVIVRDLQGYQGIISDVFPQYGIPCFLSDPQPLETKPLIRFLLYAFECVHSGYEPESVLRLVKTGLTSLTAMEILRLENYVYVWNIRGRKWCEPFTMAESGERLTGKEETLSSLAAEEALLKQKQGTVSGEEAQEWEKALRTLQAKQQELKGIEEMEQVRQKLMEPLSSFERGLREASGGADITRRLYELLQAYGAEHQFRAFVASLKDKTDEITLEREASVWNIAISLLDKMYRAMEEKPVDSRTYYELLRMYIRSTKISDIPKTVNSVTVGEAGKHRSASPRAVLVLGAAEGSFPVQPQAVGIFTDSERRYLRDEQPPEYRLPLYDSVVGASLKEKYIAYITLTAPSERLYVSYHTQKADGSSCQPSVLVREIEEIFPKIPLQEPSLPGSETVFSKELFYTERQGFDVCARLWHEPTALSASLKTYYLRSPAYAQKTHAAVRASGMADMRVKNIRLAKSLFASRWQKEDVFEISSTKLDQYSSCSFAYFMRYGLHAMPLQKAEMNARIFGSATHAVFEGVIGEYIGHMDDFVQLSEEELSGKIKHYVEAFVETLGDADRRGIRFEKICGKIRSNALRVLMRMQQQFREDRFLPAAVEAVIGGSGKNALPPYELELPTGEKIIVRGMVDRIDTAQIGQETFVRVVDYKTGTEGNSFEFSDLAGGRKLQMLLYLSAVLKSGGKLLSTDRVLLPAGVLYVPAVASSGTGESSSDRSDALASQKKKLKMSGLLLEEKPVLQQMEPELKGEFLPVSLKAKTGDFGEEGRVVSRDDFRQIFAYIDGRIKQMVMELYEGNIRVRPLQGACRYCPYGAVCRFEPGKRTVPKQKLSRQEALQQIRQTTEQETGGNTDE